MSKGKLPISGIITLESGPQYWEMLANGLITEVKTSGTLEKEPGTKVKIDLIFKMVYAPGQVLTDVRVQTEMTFNQEFSAGLSRIMEFLIGGLQKNSWLLFGYIDGDNQIPIAVVYFQDLKTAIFSQKLRDEKIQNFLPRFSVN